MTLSRLRDLCLTLPGATEQIQWGADLVFKVGGKMFCAACTEVAPVVTSFKCDDETFAELCERDGVIPAPYLARAKWVALERWDAIEDGEFKPLLEQAYGLVKAKLPKKVQESISGPGTLRPKAANASRRAAAKSQGARKQSAVRSRARRDSGTRGGARPRKNA
ncbi:MAG: MmcQ/YjbR family DNA-binding protein [Acidobacteriota bacterium]